MIRTRQRCPRCGAGRFKVLNTRVKRIAGVRIRYRGCNNCNYRPDDNVEMISLNDDPDYQLVGGQWELTVVELPSVG